MNKYTRITLFMGFQLMAFSLFSQNVNVVAGIDTNAIMIGQQLRLQFRVQHSANKVVLWPFLTDTITKGVEIIETEKTDTAFSPDKSNVTYTASYLLTSFDSGSYTIPSFPFSFTTGIDTETVFSDPLFLSVYRPEVDTTQDIRDIKGPAEIPFDWVEALPYMLAGLAGIVILVLLILYVRKKIAQRKAARLLVPEFVDPVIPPYQLAQNAIQELKEKQLWQRGKVKEYYTELTDILRVYIRDGIGVDAPEMVTEEIIKRLKFKPVSESQREVLKNLLQLSDMVKFAKAFPDSVENEESLLMSLRFIEETKPSDSPPEIEKGGSNDH